MDWIEEKVYAKVNLALTVAGKIGKLHILDSIVRNVDVFDIVKMRKREDKEIFVTYKNFSGEIINDTSRKAALLIQEKCNTNGVDIEIEKNIPIAAGMGGSSADAAGVARCMERLFSIGKISAGILLSIGSDVPYMYTGGNKRIRGTGDIVEDVTLPETYLAIIVCPGGVSTERAYKLYDEYGGENGNIEEILSEFLQNKSLKLYNALQKAAININPAVGKGLELLKKAGFEAAVMTGSGSGVVGIERNEKKYIRFIQKLKGIMPEDYKLIQS